MVYKHINIIIEISRKDEDWIELTLNLHAVMVLKIEMKEELFPKIIEAILDIIRDKSLHFEKE